MVKRTLNLVYVLLLLQCAALAQITGGGGGGSGSGVGIFSVAGLPGGQTVGTVAVVNNGSTGTDCTVGGGANLVFCRWGGASWATFAAGAASAGGSNTQVQYNTSGSLGGIAQWTTNGTTTLTQTATGVLALNGTSTVATGGTITFSGSGVVNANQANGGTFPASATVLATNGSNQPTAAALASADIYVGNGSNLPVAVAPSLDLSLANTGAFTVVGVNGTAVPASASFLSSNGSSQLAAAACTSAFLLVGNGSNIAKCVSLTGDSSITNAGVMTNSGVNGATIPASAAIIGSNGSNQLVSRSISQDASVTSSGVWTNLGLNGTLLSGLATGVLKVTTSSGNISSLPLQGSDANVLSAGVVSGTSSSLCTDASGGATTVGCPGASLPTASAEGQVLSAVAAGTAYAAQTKPLTDTRDDPSAGANICIRLNDQAGVVGSNLTGSNVQIIQAWGDRNSSKNECGATDISAFANYEWLNGSTNLHTDTGFHIESWQQIQGEIADVVGVRANANLSGTVIQATSAFPTTGNVTTSGSANNSGNSFLTIALSAGENIVISPGARFQIAGDGTLYTVTKCTGSAHPGPCANSTINGGAAAYNSQFYALAGAGTVTINIIPNLASSPTNGTAITLYQPLTELGNISAQNTGQTGVANDWSRIVGSLIDCENTPGGVGIGALEMFGQENSQYKDVSISGCGFGMILANPVDSGPYENLNIGSPSDSFCTTPDIPLEVEGIGTEIRRVTINGNNCVSTKQSSGLVHITNYPQNVTGYSGTVDIHQLHFEGSCIGGIGSGCPGSGGTTLDGILIDTANPLPGQQITGPVSLHEIIGAPSAFPVTNMVHVASNFVGTLDYRNSTGNSGSTNVFKDDVNGNTFTRGHNLNGVGFAEMDGTQALFTNLNSVDMQTGIDIYAGTLAGYAGSNTPTWSLAAPTGNVTATGAINFRGATHTGTVQTGLIAAIPATCTAGDLYFATDQTHGQSLNECYSGNVWVQQLNSGASGANVNLSNLSGVAINSSMIPGSGVDNGIDLGSLTLRWRNLYLGTSVIWTNGSGSADTGLCRGAAGQVDVSSGGACAATGNIFAAGFASGSASVPGTGEISLPSSAAPSAPASGTLIWFDSTDLRVHEIGNAATIGTTVVALANSSHKWLNSLSTTGVLTQTQPAISDLTATFTSPITLSTNALSISGVTGEQGNGALLQLSTGTVNLNRITKFDTNGNTINSNLLEASSLLSNAANTATTYSGALDASANAAQAATTFRGGDQTGAGGASSTGGGALVRGGNNAATNASSQAGGIELLTGSSTGATQGLQGPFIAGIDYVKGGGTSTLWNLQCGTGSAMTVNDCGASPNNILGVAEAVNSNTVVTLFGEGQTFVNASAAVTLNHTVCAGSTAGKVTDSAGTATCTNTQGETVGIVVATSGAWTLPDGVTVTATTTLPLIQFSPGVTIPTTSGSPSLDAVTGSTAQTTRSESVAGDNYTFGGIETASFTSYITIQDTNSTNNNTSVGLISNCAGTSTGCIGFIANTVSGTGDLFRLYAGSTVTNGTLTGGTEEFGISASGVVNKGVWGSGATKIAANAGGTAIDSSASTGVPNVVGGTWTVSTTLPTNLVMQTPASITLTNGTGLPINGVVSATGAITTIADGNNPLTINCAQTTGSQACATFGETTAATGSSDVDLQLTTLTTTTAIPLQITQGAAGPSAANAPNVISVSAAAAGGAATASVNGSTGAGYSFAIGAGSAGGATTGNGGNAGTWTITSAAGGAAGGTATNNGGNGSSWSWTGGIGGAGGTGAGTAGSGGGATWTMGAPGANSATGTAGADGQFLITGTAPASTANATGVAVGELFEIDGVAGGACTGAACTGGVGSFITLQSGTGGGVGGASGNAVGGAAGNISFIAAAGANSINAGANSNGGNIILTPGAAGTGGSGAAGTAGAVQITAGSLQLGTAPVVTTVGTGFPIIGTEGTEPASIAATADAFVMDSTLHCPVQWNAGVNMGCAPITLVRQITGSDWSCGTTGTVSSCVAAQTIGTLTWTLPLATGNWSMDCTLIVGQATGVTANNWNLQTATNGVTNTEADFEQATAAAAVASGVTTGQASTTTTFNIGGTWTQGATGTKMPAHIHATFEGVSASGTVVNLQLVAPTVGDLVTIYRGSSCSMTLKQ
jgi:hypothetical protein